MICIDHVGPANSLRWIFQQDCLKSHLLICLECRSKHWQRPSPLTTGKCSRDWLDLSIIRDWFVLCPVFLCHRKTDLQYCNQGNNIVTTSIKSTCYFKTTLQHVLIIIHEKPILTDHYSCIYSYITSLCLALICIPSVIIHKMAGVSPSHPNVWAWCLRDAVSHCIHNVNIQNGLWFLHSNR